MSAPAANGGALRGVRVLDFGRFISAPYCGMLLADMGAEVIRVDRPGGEHDRRIGLRGPHGENFTYPGLARNKRGITLDLNKPASREVLRDLVARCDVFLHNFSLGAANALGIAYDDVRAMRSDIIYTAITCYGTRGPHAELPGFDPIAQVLSGAAALTGTAGDPPLRAGVPWTDYSTGLAAALGTVLALRHRDATGQGQRVDCSLLQTAVSYTAPMVAEAVVAEKERPRLGNRAPYLGPTDLYRTRDGWVYITTATDAMWRSLAKLIGRADLLEAPGLATDEQRFDRRDEIDPLVAAWVAARTSAEVQRALAQAHVPCGACHGLREVPHDPQVRACDMLEYIDLEVPGMPRVPVSGVPVRLSESPGAVTARAPRIGEHNEQVFCQLLGYDAARVQELVAARVL